MKKTLTKRIVLSTVVAICSTSLTGVILATQIPFNHIIKSNNNLSQSNVDWINNNASGFENAWQTDQNLNIETTNSYGYKVVDKNITRTPNNSIYYGSTYEEAKTQNNGSIAPETFFPNVKNNQSDTTILKKLYDEFNSETSIMNSNVNWDNIKSNKLQKHAIADLQYQNSVKSDAKAVKKEFYLTQSTPGYITTGLYIPPGETFTIEFEGLTADEISQLNWTVVLNANEINTSSNEINEVTSRMPILQVSHKIENQSTDNSFVCKFGSPFGGLINIKTNGAIIKNNQQIKMTISGAIETLNYVHGFTTEQEWNRLLKEANGVMFDIRCDGIQFLGATEWLTNKEYPYNAMSLWYKMTLNSFYAYNKNTTNVEPVRILCSRYVHGNGAAVSYAPNHYVSAPNSWAENILDFKSNLYNGNWGIIHEFNHQNQGVENKSAYWWGFGDFNSEGEVTVNALNVADYLDFTRVTAKRTNPKDLTGWNWSINGYNAIEKLNNYFNKNISGTDRLALYSAFIEVAGTQAFKDSVRAYRTTTYDYEGKKIVVPSELSNNNPARYTYIISMITGYDWTDFYHDFNIYTEDVYKKLKENSNLKNLANINPAYSFYAQQTQINGDEFNKTGQYFVMNQTGATNLKLKEYTLTTNSYQLSDFKIVEQPKYGKLDQVGDFEFNYNPKNEQQDDSFVYSVICSNKSNPQDKTTLFFKVNLKTYDSNKEDNNYSANDLFTDDYINKSSGSLEISYKDKIEYVKLLDNNNNPTGNNLTRMYDGNTSETATSAWNGSSKNFEIAFKNNIDINSIFVGTNNVQSQIPDKIKISYLNKNNEWVYLYDGDFIWETKHWVNGKTSSYYDLYSFNQINTNKIRIETSSNEWKQFYWLTEFGFSNILDSQSVVPFASSYVYKNNETTLKKLSNLETNGGTYNNSLMQLNGLNDEMQFSFLGTGFSLNGNKLNNGGSFDVFVDDVFYQTINTNNSQNIYKTPLFMLNSLENKPHKIKIVNKSNSPVELSYANIDGQVLPYNYQEFENQQTQNSTNFSPSFATVSKPLYYSISTIVPIILGVGIWFGTFYLSKKFIK